MKSGSFKTSSLIALLLALGPLLIELPWLPSVFCGVLILIWIFRAWTPPSYEARWALQGVAVFSGVFYFWHYGTLLSPESASSLMATMATLKLLDLKTHKDSLLFHFMLLLLMMFYVLFSQTLTSTVIVFINYFLFISLLLATHRQKLGLQNDQFNWKQLVSLETLIALPLLLVLFLFFPRFTTSWGGFGAATTQAVYGFSETLQPGKMQNLMESDKIAFRVLFSSLKKPAPENLYFQGSVLRHNTGWIWKMTDEKLSYRLSPPLDEMSDYEILLEPRFEKTLFTLTPTQNISVLPSQLLFALTDTGSFQLRFPIQSKIKLQGQRSTSANNLLSPPTPQDLQLNQPPMPQLDAWLKPLRSQAPEDQLKTLLEFFQNSGFTYTTQTPNYPQIEDFLFGQKSGFCEHFSSSFAVMARSLGLPTRVVVGFQGAEPNPLSNYMIVKDKHAHAWNQVYLPNKGWTQVDVTSLIAPQRIFQGALYNQNGFSIFDEKKLNWWTRTSLALDAINSRFSLLLMNYNLDSQMELLDRWNLPKLGISSTRQALGLGLLICGGIFVWLLRRKDAKADHLAKSYLLFLQKLSAHGLERNLWDGPLELQQKARTLPLANRAEVDSIFESYRQLRFGSNASPSDGKRFHQRVKAFKARSSSPH